MTSFGQVGFCGVCYRIVRYVSIDLGLNFLAQAERWRWLKWNVFLICGLE